MEARLKLSQQVIGDKIGFVLGGYNMFRIFDRKGEIGDGLEITPVAGATAASLGVWGD